MGNSRSVLELLLTVLTLCTSFIGVASQGGSTCYVFGTEHVFTFDKQRIDFNTNLELTVSKTCPPAVQVNAAFDISVINENKYSNVDSASQVQCVKMIYKSDVAKICADQTASVNGDSVADAMLTSNSQLMIYYGTKGREIAIQVADTLVRVSVTKAGLVTVTVPSSYRSKLCGLCGDYNGDSTNDLRTASGEDVSAEDIYVRGARIAQSYLVPPGIGEVQTFTPSACYNIPSEEQRISEPDMCGLYDASTESSTVHNCLATEPQLAQTFSELCKYDYCENYLNAKPGEVTSSGCEDNNAICERNDDAAKESVNSVAEVFVELCNSLNHSVSDQWRTDYEAIVTCGIGSTYSSTGPYCPNVCGLAADRCAATGVDGCVCTAGQWKEGDTCVDSSVCGCSDGNTGEYYKVSEWWVDNLCTRNYTCVSTNQINAQQLQCSENSDCTSSGCVCMENYVGDGITCDRTCGPGQQAISNNCADCPVGTYKEAWGTESCVSCPSGEVTDEPGSTLASDCKGISMVNDSLYSTAYTQVADATFRIRVPKNVLRNGLPYGGQMFRRLWVSTNGVISFDKPFVGRSPVDLLTVTQPLLAPFWFRQDIRVNGGISPVTNSAAELRVSTYNKIDSNKNKQMEAANALNQIQILLSSYEKYRELSQQFQPTYAIVVSWKNTVPNPAAFYQYREAVYYQCVIVTNGMRTYAIYIYPSGGITLMSQFQIRSIYMGFNAQDGGVHEFNYYKSGNIGINTLDIDPSNTDVAGRWVFEVANLGPDNPYAAMCILWYNVQKFYVFPYGLIEPLGDPCPCNSASAKYDERFYFDYSADCAYSLTKKYTLIGHSLFQKCCYYRGGALITDSTKAGYPMFFHPLMNYGTYEAVDLTPFIHCCKSSNQCDLYREYRPVDQCEEYRAPKIACGYGDPHIYTLDQALYTYNPIGEFWMIKSDLFSMQCRMIQSLDNDLKLVDATQFGAFVMTSLTGNSSVVHLEINNNRTDFQVRVDGNSISNLLDNDVKEQVIAYTGVVLKKYNGSISVAFETGFTFRFSLRLNVLSIQTFVPETAQGHVDGLLGHYDGNSTNDLTDRNGNVVCVIGFDCDPSKIHYDFGETWRIQDGESLFWYKPGWSTATYTNKDFQPIFFVNSTSGPDLSVCNNDLECEYDVYLTHDTNLGQDSVNIRLEVEDKASILGNAAPAVIGPTYINATVNHPVAVVYYANYSGDNTVELFALVMPPNSTFEIDPNGTQYTFTWTPEDLSTQCLKISANETGVVDAVPAVSPVFEVTIRLSDDCENGEADFDTVAVNGAVTPTFYIVQCVCDEGWVGSTCAEDYDGCIDKPCVVGECEDVPAASYDPINGTTYECNIEECPDGYERKVIDDVMEPDCTDVDECRESICINANCSNVVGSFVCTCMEGYAYIKGSKTECTNVDECEGGLDNCDDICTDTEGSFSCSCIEGYTLDSNGYSCTAGPIFEIICQALNCEHACVVNTTVNVTISDAVNGTCTCPRGKRLNADNRTCDSVDECATGDNVCQIETGAICHDIAHGYECRCPPIGYRPLKNNYDPCIECEVGFYGENCTNECDCGDRARACNITHGCTECNVGWEGEQCRIDINECLEDPCGSTANCTNTRGSFYCACPDGFINSNFTDCENVDECTTFEPCSKLAKCTDTEGSFNCACNDGFTGNGITCYDINECSPTDGSDAPCVATASCRNERGSYQCICPEGYHGNGKRAGSGCENDNECVEASNICEGAHSECVDTEGSYACICVEGYAGDGLKCLDVDECTENTYNCSSFAVEFGYGGCVNTEGGYSCETKCNGGYNLTYGDAGDFLICVPYDECMSSVSPCDTHTQVCTSTADSYECTCLHGYERFSETNTTCVNIDECERGTHDCTAPEHGQSRCEDTAGSYRCILACEYGYVLDTTGDGDTCVDVDECSQNACNSLTEDCTNSIGSYRCACKDGFANESGVCSDINECLNATICGNKERTQCTNLQPSYICSCLSGYIGDNCMTRIETAEFIEAEQVFGLDFNIAWEDETSEERKVFNSLMAEALAPMYDSFPQFLGVNILAVISFDANSSSTRQRRDTTGYETAVTYNTVFKEDVDNIDVIHQALDYLVTNKYMLTFNHSSITDKLLIAFSGVFDRGEVTCDSTLTSNGVESKIIDCQGRGSCIHAVGEEYPMCECDDQYEGYNCGTELDITMDGPGNLMGLWVAVAVAGILLLGGLLACTLVLAYQRRQRAPPVHRDPRGFSSRDARGPALFNPSSRRPTEAFNFQFPVGSVRDDMSDGYSSISTASTRTQRTQGRVGSTVPFAPRWPKAYYSQLDDPNDE